MMVHSLVASLVIPAVFLTIVTDGARLPDTHPWYDSIIQQPWSLGSQLQRVFSVRLADSWLSKPASSSTSTSSKSSYKTFGLRQAYHQGMDRFPGLRATTDFDYQIHSESWGISPSDPRFIPPIKTIRQVITRPKDVKRYLQVRGKSLEEAACASSTELDWEDVEVEAPDTTNRQTLLAFAKMSALAYSNNTSEWVGFGGYNLSDSFGWDSDGIRGHIFTTTDNSTIVVSLKGTSNAFLPGGGETARKDKTNDNLLFSCCCARVSWSWSTVCDCYSGHGDRCEQTCLERALVEKSLYYPATTDLFNNISYMYPDAQVWITGHSLGGALSSLLGITFGAPTITFQAPGERMAAMRLHLPLPPSKNPDESPVSALPITHVYQTADPIVMGQCVGAGSLCSSFGYAMESKCHSGKSIVYDTVEKLGWASSINTHRINALIDDVLSEDWDKKVKKAKGKTSLMRWRWPWRGNGDDDDDGEDGDDDDLKPVPRRRSEDSCVDCTNWHFIDDERD